MNKTPAPRILQPSNRYVNRMLRDYRIGIKQYLRGLLFPEEAISGSQVCKQPSYVGLPTSNVVFKEQLNIIIGPEKKFGLIWVPNYLATKPSIDYHITDIFNQLKPGQQGYYSHLYFTTNPAQTDIWKFHTSFVPNIDLSKYRLVSAKISVQYNGTLMNQSGQLHSCVVYDDLPVFLGAVPVGQENPTVDVQLVTQEIGKSMNSYLDIERIRNGLWPKYVNITNTTGQIDNIALPTDPTDHTFFPLAHYYANHPQGFDHTDTYSHAYATSADGGHLSYVYLGDGLPEGSNITVIVYYNFEIIATQTTASFLRGKKGDDNPIRHFISSKDDVIIEELIKYAANNNNLNNNNNSAGSYSIINEPKNNVGGFINSLTNMLLGALSGDYMSLIKTFGPKNDKYFGGMF